MKQRDELTYRYPRTLQEAFGPGATLHSDDATKELTALDWSLVALVVWLMMCVGFIAIALEMFE